MTTDDGGVLSAGDIRERVLKKELFIVKGELADDALRPAAYDMQVASDGLIAPRSKPVDPGGSGSHPYKIVLQPGDAALFTTAEEFRLPTDVAGNIAIKNRPATQGLMLLSGMLVDPGYGWRDDNDKLGCRLYLNVANIGEQAIEIRPGKDRIATIQFLRVHKHGELTEIDTAKWKDQKLPSLGFLTELKELKDKVERSDTRSEQIVLFGFVVLAVSLISVSLSTILPLAHNAGLIEDVHNLEPSSTGGLVLIIAALLSFGAFVSSFARLATNKREWVWPKTKSAFAFTGRCIMFIPEYVDARLEEHRYEREIRKSERQNKRK
jgi:deoxycytidine triphosphate deaminase